MTGVDLAAGKEKRRASLISLLAVVFLIVLKVAVGLLTGSLGVLAQAADSVLDLVAVILAFFAVRVADRPADAGHPYGHGKAENLAALAEMILLLVTCGWIIYEAIQRLFFRTVTIEADVWGIAVMIFSIVVSLWLSTYLMRVARQHRSQSLEGNALNFRTDVLSSSVVLLALVLVALSHRLGSQWAWLEKADAVAALIVALMVLRVSLRLGWHAMGELLDAAPPGLAERIAVESQAVPGVETVGPVRVRQAGASTFADLTVTVDRSTPLEDAHRIAAEVEAAASTLVNKGDIVVHVDAVRPNDESLPQTVSAIAARLGLQAHNIHAHEVRGRYFVDLHVEVPVELTLAQTHDRMKRLEAVLRRELPYISDVNTHIEPRSAPVARAHVEPALEADLQAQIATIVGRASGLSDCHDIQIRPGPGGHDVVLHCLADPDLPVAEAHLLAEAAKQQLRAQIPGIGQVLVHLEPAEEG